MTMSGFASWAVTAVGALLLWPVLLKAAEPPPDHTATLTVTVKFDGEGKWSNPRNGAYSNLKFHREMACTVPLNGVYSAGSGFMDSDRREQPQGFMIPDMKRYLVWTPRDRIAPAGCGQGRSVILDESSGKEVGDPGQPPLVPFVQTIKGGGVFPSGDKTVPERDLCESAVTFDFQKHVLHLVIDGSDAHVKVTNVHNGFTAPRYSLRLQGDDADVKAKLRFFDIPMPAGAKSVEGSSVIKDFSHVSGPDHSSFPLQATVQWKVTQEK
jgi:hypothetical protein